MARKKNNTSELDAAQKQLTPLAQRLSELISNTGELKEYLGCSIQAINQYKSGESRPSLENLCKIADFYGVSTDYLLGRIGAKPLDYDIQFIHEYTGLSDESIQWLHSISDKKDWLEVLGQILSERSLFELILEDIAELRRIAPKLYQGGPYAKNEPSITAEERAAGYFVVDRIDYADLLRFKIEENLRSITHVVELSKFYRDKLSKGELLV